MTAFIRDWSAAYEAIPANADDASEGASRIRENRVDTRERMDVDHYLPGTAPADKTEEGEHRKVTFYTQIADPTPVADKGFLYIKDTGGRAELYWANEDSHVIQLTSGGNASPIIATANTWVGIQTFSAAPVFSAGIGVTGDVTISQKIVHAGDADTYLEYTADSIAAVAGGAQGWNINASGFQIAGANARVSSILDEDAMGSNSAAALATQQSIKAYVDGAKTFEFVSSAAITAATSISILGFVAGYDYIITLSGFCPTDDAEALWMRWSDDGSTFEADAADYGWNSIWNGSSTEDISDSEIAISGTNTFGNDANYNSCMEITIHDPNQATEQTTCHWIGYAMGISSGEVRPVHGGARFIQGTNAIQGAEFKWSGGSTFKAQGDFTIWRRKRS